MACKGSTIGLSTPGVARPRGSCLLAAGANICQEPTGERWEGLSPSPAPTALTHKYTHTHLCVHIHTHPLPLTRGFWERTDPCSPPMNGGGHSWPLGISSCPPWWFHFVSLEAQALEMLPCVGRDQTCVSGSPVGKKGAEGRAEDRAAGVRLGGHKLCLLWKQQQQQLGSVGAP